MLSDDLAVDDFIPGRLKKSKSYHKDYGRKTYREIKDLARQRPPDQRAVQMKKLVEQKARLMRKRRK